MSPGHPAATALLADETRIGWIGDEAEAAEHVGVRTIDLGGALLTPAFVDAHIHATSTGLALTGLDLRSAASLDAALAAVEQAARAARGRPVLGSGWDETRWPQARPPSAAELDRASYGGAVYLARVDVHSALASSALMAAVPELAGLSGFDGSGWVRGPAHDAVRGAAFAAMTSGQRRDAQRAALTRAAELGIACVHEMAGPIISSADDLSALLALAADESLPLVVGYWAELFGIETAFELGAVGAAGDLFCDGSLGSHTAALHEPYVDRPDTSGALRCATDEVTEHIVRCERAGLQAGFHAIGDAAVDQVLDAFEAAAVRLASPLSGGHRIEHAEFVRDPARLAASGLVASMQPCFDAAWGSSDGMYAQRLGVARARQLNRFADLVAAGVPLVFGSDAPVTELGPWSAVRAAAWPHDRASAIPVDVAFAAHSRAGWRAGGRDTDALLRIGDAATFAVWQAEPGPDGYPDIAPGRDLPACLATVLDGKPIFDAGVLNALSDT